MPRYLKGITLRLDKLRADPARDAQRLAELRPLEQRYLRALAERKGARRRAPGGVPLAAGGAARELLRAGAAHAAAGERQAPRQGLGAVEPLRAGCSCGTPRRAPTLYQAVSEAGIPVAFRINGPQVVDYIAA